MAGNAHARRQRRRPSPRHKGDCIYCQSRHNKNSNGHRHNPASARGGKHNDTHKVHGYDRSKHLQLYRATTAEWQR